jgi:CheY-like chemotaxis protein
MDWDEEEQLSRVLLVEDAPFLRYAFGRLLKFHGFEVMEANDGEEALSCVENFRPQLVVTDLTMPVMGGVEMIRRLRSNPNTRDLPIVAITANATAHSEKEAREAGAVDFLTKPIDVPTLVERLRAIKS